MLVGFKMVQPALKRSSFTCWFQNGLAHFKAVGCLWSRLGFKSVRNIYTVQKNWALQILVKEHTLHSALNQWTFPLRNKITVLTECSQNFRKLHVIFENIFYCFIRTWWHISFCMNFYNFIQSMFSQCGLHPDWAVIPQPRTYNVNWKIPLFFTTQGQLALMHYSILYIPKTR